MSDSSAAAPGAAPEEARDDDGGGATGEDDGNGDVTDVVEGVSPMSDTQTPDDRLRAPGNALAGLAYCAPLRAEIQAFQTTGSVTSRQCTVFHVKLSMFA